MSPSNAAPNRRSEMNIGTIIAPGSMSMLSAGNRFSRRSINSIAVPVGPVSRNRSTTRASPKSQIALLEWNGPKSSGARATRISATFLTMAPPRPVNVTASIQPRCASFQSKNCKKKATVNTCRSSKRKNNRRNSGILVKPDSGLAAYYLRNFDDCRVTARQIKGYLNKSAEFHRASDPSSFEALVAFDLVARLARRGWSNGGISSLQQHSGGEKEGRQL